MRSTSAAALHRCRCAASLHGRCSICRFAWITTFLAAFLLVALVVVAVRAGGSGLLVWRTAWITMLALCAGMYMVSLCEWQRAAVVWPA